PLSDPPRRLTPWTPVDHVGIIRRRFCGNIVHMRAAIAVLAEDELANHSQEDSFLCATRARKSSTARFRNLNAWIVWSTASPMKSGIDRWPDRRPRIRGR